MHLPPPATHMSAPMHSTVPLNVQQQLAPLQVAGLHEPPPPDAALEATALDATALDATLVLDAAVVVAPLVAVATEEDAASVVVAPLEATLVEADAPPLPQL